MFNVNFINNDICEFTDSVSESILLTKFIEESDNSYNIYNIISKWNLKDGTFIKNIDGYSVDMDEPRSLYIVNSLYSGMKFCLDRYVEMKKITDEQIISKKFNVEKQTEESELNNNHDTNIDFKYIIVMHLNDDYEGGEIVFTKQNITLKPGKGSILIFPNKKDLEFKFNKISNGNKYVVLHGWSN